MFTYQQSLDYCAALVAALGANAVDAAARRWAHDDTVIVTRAGYAYGDPSLGHRPVGMRAQCALASYLATVEFPFDAVTKHHVPDDQ